MTKLFMSSLLIFVINCEAIGLDIPTWMKEKEPIKMTYYLGLGSSIPTGDLKDTWNLGFHLYGRADFAASPGLSVWAGAEYHYFSNSEPAVDGYNLSVINLTLDLKLNGSHTGEGLNPYFFGGAGLAINDYTDSFYNIAGDTLVNQGIVRFDTKTGLMIEIGGGVEYKRVFVQGRYVSSPSNKSQLRYIPVTVGVKF